MATYLRVNLPSWRPTLVAAYVRVSLPSWQPTLVATYLRCSLSPSQPTFEAAYLRVNSMMHAKFLIKCQGKTNLLTSNFQLHNLKLAHSLFESSLFNCSSY